MVAMEVSADAGRGADFDPALAPDELAFYYAVADNELAVTEMGTGVLADIARDLVRSLRRDVTTDWVSRDDVRANYARQSSACSPSMATHPTPSPPPSSSCCGRWKPSPRSGLQPPTSDEQGCAVQCDGAIGLRSCPPRMT